MKALSSIVAAGLCIGLLVGCDKSTDPSTDAANLEKDVANAVAGSISQDGGGVADQVNDIVALSSTGGISGSAALMETASGVDGSAAIDTVYDAATGWWTVTFTRTRIGLISINSIYRKYQYQYLNKSSQPQRRFIVSTVSGPDTARTINFKILQGKGYQRNPWRVHRLDSLAGQWSVTNANTAVVTINGTYYRSGVDTLRLNDAERTHANALSATLINVTRPRMLLGGTTDDISGTITGLYTATITFTKGDLYKERNPSKEFTITLSGQNADIGIGGRIYRALWLTGEFKGQL